MIDLVVHLTVAASDAELAGGRLWELGTIAVEERPVGTDVLLVAAFPTADAARWAAEQLGDKGARLVEVDDRAWRDEWKQHVPAMDVGEHLRVVPAWRPDTIASGRLQIVLDPGACFGSGTHPTTRTALAELETLVTAHVAVLDVGTGSGILAVAAACLGAGAVDAIDIDPASVPVTMANAAANGVSATVRASTSPLAEIAGPYDVVVANVSAGTLADLAPDLLRVAGDRGSVVLSGMLDGQWRHVSDRFAPLELARERHVDGWTTVVLHPPSGLGAPS